MEVGIVLATVGAVVAEYLAGGEGLGWLAVAYLNQLQVAKLFDVIVVLSVMGGLLYGAVAVISMAVCVGFFLVCLTLFRRFQIACLRRIDDLLGAGGSVLLVSHDLDLVAKRCDRVLVLHEGEPHFLGDVAEALERYHVLNRPDYHP